MASLRVSDDSKPLRTSSCVDRIVRSPILSVRAFASMAISAATDGTSCQRLTYHLRKRTALMPQLVVCLCCMCRTIFSLLDLLHSSVQLVRSMLHV